MEDLDTAAYKEFRITEAFAFKRNMFFVPTSEFAIYRAALKDVVRWGSSDESWLLALICGGYMEIIEVCERTDTVIHSLLKVWEKSVKATHLFLSECEMENIKKYVPQALSNVERLVTANDENSNPVAFMGIEKECLEMLFITPEERGKGLGKQLIQYGIEHYGIKSLAVNKQNPQAKGFYEHMGFQVYKRTDYDEQGNPYPLLYMSRL